MKKTLLYLLLIFQTTIICGQDINKISQIQDDLKFLSSDKLEEDLQEPMEKRWR